MLNISKSLNESLLIVRRKLKYAKVLHDPDDKSWRIRHPGEGTLYPKWKGHLIKMQFLGDDSENDYYETTQHIVCYDSKPGGEDSTTCTYENGCFFCIGANYNISIQEIYDIESMWQWLETDQDKIDIKKAVFENWGKDCNMWGCLIGVPGCLGCIRPRVCVLQDADGKRLTSTTDTKNGEITEEIGWCKKCSRCKKCRVEERKPPNQVTRRIYWTVGCTHSGVGEITLCEDVCDDHHSVERDCPCSETARNFHSDSYVYLQTT